MPAVAATPLRLVVGLGNPGREYTGTRHNVGFEVLDRLAARRRLEPWAFKNDWQALWAREGSQYLFLKPQTFMNESGRAVGAAVRFYKLPPESVLVVYDDLALPVGRLRLRSEGSSGGQNGMQNIIEHLNTSAVPRLRVGIGAARGGGGRMGMVGHVLGKFRPEEREDVAVAIERAADAVEHAFQYGLEAAMNLYNRDPATEE